MRPLAPGPPSGEQWLHEIKYDGYRVQPITPKVRPAAGNVVNLMDALRASIGQEQAPKPAKKKPAGQKEMLLPIDGKKPAKEGGAKKSSARAQRKSA